MNTNDQILTVEAAAELLSLSDSAVYKLLQQGDLPGAKIGGQWRVRRSDLERAFDLARARARAAQREKEAGGIWAPALDKLRAKNERPEFELTRCLWCPEWTPTWSGARYTTLCSFECARELRQAFSALGWTVTSDYTLSPIYEPPAGDSTTLMLGPWNWEAEQHGMVPDYELIAARYKTMHARGPLRELLLLEHPYMRDYNRRPPEEPTVASGSRDARPAAREEASESEAS